jgi:AraC-like DNA-binding protein
MDSLLTERLQRFRRIRATEPEIIRNDVSLLTQAQSVTFSRRRAKTSVARCNVAGLDKVSLFWSGGFDATTVHVPERHRYGQLMGLIGTSEVRIGGEALEVSSSRSFSYGPGTSHFKSFGPAYTHFAITIDASEMSRYVESIIGRPVPLNIGVRPGLAGDTYLRRCVFFVVSEMESNELPAAILVEFSSLLKGAFAFANFADIIFDQKRSAPAAATWQARLARDYIEANWAAPITVEDLARTIGVSARSLFRSFRLSYGVSPKIFLRQVRLQQARRLLSGGLPGATVTGVALMCAFSNVGLFARYYQQEFGELPSSTLQSARGGSRGQRI